MRPGAFRSTSFRRCVAVSGAAFAAALVATTPAAFAHRATAPSAKVKGNIAQGRLLFRANCGTCHTLAAAGTHGHIGPNLTWDELEYSTVTWMVSNGSSLMPGFKGVLKTAQIDELAAFVTLASSS